MTLGQIENRLDMLVGDTFDDDTCEHSRDWRHTERVLDWFDLALHCTGVYTACQLRNFILIWARRRHLALTTDRLREIDRVVSYWDAWQLGVSRLTRFGLLEI